MKKALIITWERFQDHELIYPYYSLKEHGFEVTLMANKIGRIFGDLGTHMNCDITTQHLEDPENRTKFIEDFDVLVLPGGVKSLEKVRQEKGVLLFIKEWDERKKTIFSICNGAQLLISSKILKGRRISGYYSIDVDIENAGAIYDRANVVVDENIISTPHYNYMGEWMLKCYEVFEKRQNN